jgi:GT2 family glycosyltransferase
MEQAMYQFGTDVLEPPPIDLDMSVYYAPDPMLVPQVASGTAVIVCTRGRPEIVKSLVDQLARQTLSPDHIFIIASSEADVAGLDRAQDRLTVHIGRTGSTFQRNDGLALAGSRFGQIVFFDDDFVPSRYWLERMAAIFHHHADIVGVTGRVLADGTRDAGIPLQTAIAMVAHEDVHANPASLLDATFPYGSNVGCNMAFRYSAVHDIVFDERLPLYAWHEDSDFRGQAERRGRVVRADALWGVHLGHKKGRVPGLTLGYAQIANAVYLGRKGTVPARFLARIAFKNLLVNALRSLRPETYVDRRGRLRGNLLALFDWVRGRLAPERILQL